MPWKSDTIATVVTSPGCCWTANQRVTSQPLQSSRSEVMPIIE
jgi:hypothetical protein